MPSARAGGLRPEPASGLGPAGAHRYRKEGRKKGGVAPIGIKQNFPLGPSGQFLAKQNSA